MTLEEVAHGQALEEACESEAVTDASEAVVHFVENEFVES